MAAAVVGSLLMPVTVAAAAGPDYSRKWSPPNTALPQTASVKGHDVAPAAPAKPAHEVPPTWQAPKPATAPKHGRASVRLGAAPAVHPLAKGQQAEAGTELPASGLPVTLAPLAGSPAGGQQVEVEVADQKTATAAGVPGVLVSLTPAVGSATGPVRLGVDLGRDGAGFGADWASRAQLVTLPGCALTTPQAKGCLKQTPLASHYDRVNQQLVADVTIAPNTAVAKSAPAAGALASAAVAAAPATVVAAVSGTSSGAGTYSATPMNPSQAWTAGGSSGAFTYSYPIQLPPALGGGAPSVALSYDSSSVDGKTSSTNSQASWIGDGWDYNPGFVERSYKPCSDSGITNSGDSCWAGANLSLSLAGHSGELVPNDDPSCQANAPGTTEQSNCTWRLKDDDATKVQFLTGATNGTWNGSYIKVTDTTGTAYYFGLDHLPDASGNPTAKGPDSGSAWTVPVYSPNPGDPCYDSSKGQGSWCQSAWRWNLDYVVDPHGNLTTYTYTPETNYYARGGAQNNGTGTNTQYTRAGVLATIGYGQFLSDQLAANGAYNPAAKIVFASVERCVTSDAACDPANRTAANAANWPDVPIDQQCAATGTCTVYGPTFWTSKWLKSVTTQVRVNSTYQDVDSYALNHSFVDVQNATENTKVPWLDSVQRTAIDTQASSTQVPLPPVQFTSMLLRNRVDGTNLVPARPAFSRPRIQLITTETGGTIGVDYWPADCSRVNNSMPASADTDTRSCFNVKWHPPTEQKGDAPIDDWFLRYPVRTVTTDAATIGSVSVTKAYTYGKAAWHRNDSPLTKDADRTWDQFRGYASVTTVTGSGQDGDRSQTSTSYYQGMNGDVTSSGTRSVKAAGPMSGQVTDSDWLAGQTLESDTYTQENGGIISYTVNTSSGETTTATHNRGSLPALVARYSASTFTTVAKEHKADGTWRSTAKTTTTDPAHGNTVTSVLDTADGLPDICTRTSYAAGSDPQVLALPSQVLKVSGTSACTAAATAGNTVSWTNSYYDNLSYGKLGAAHDVTATVSADHFDAGGNPQFTTVLAGYDGYGRQTSSTNQNTTDSAHPGGATVTTAFTGKTGELPTGTSVTTPAPAGASDTATGRTTTTVLDSARALPLSVTDPNGRTTTTAYDAMGRLTSVWLPGRATTASASRTFQYSVPGKVNGTVVPPTTTSQTLRANGTYATSVQIMDGLGRTVQTQSDPATSFYTGRLITDTVLDSQGRTIRSNAAWYNKDARPGTTLYQTTTQQVPAQTHTVYDGLGRPVTTEFVAYGVAQNSTTTAYPGADRTDVTPPSGATATSTVTDARGRTSQLWQYKTATVTGNASDADVTTYTYTPDGKPATQKDAAGNTWTHGYDLFGRELTSTDPDTGTSTKTYDTAGRLATTTDARKQTLAYTYDLLGRMTGSYVGSVSAANQRTGFTYDTVVKGQPGASIRYDSGNAYTSEVTAYNTAYQPTTTKLTIPGSEVGQSGTPFTYTRISVYDPITGALTAENRDAIGDIPSETLTYTYEKYGLLLSYGAYNGATYDLSDDYDAYGRSTRTTVNPWGTQIVLTNTYDESTGRPLTQFVDKQTAATGAVQQVTYAYNQAGKLTGVRSIPDAVPSNADLQCYGYDYLGRLTTAWTDTGTLTMAPQPSVGGQGACTDSTPTSGAQAPKKTTVGGPAPYWQTYGYDLTGNRKSLVQHDPSGDTTKDTTVTQTFNTSANAPITTPNPDSGTGGPHALMSTSTQTGTGSAAVSTTQYDASGNTTLITDPAELTTLTWDPENRLAVVDKRTQVSNTHYLYDAAGNQLIRRYHGKNTVFLGGDELVYDPNATTKLTGTRYYQMPGGLTLVRQGSQSTFQISDARGTGTLSLDGTTLTESRRPVDPFGNPRGTQPGAWAGDRGYVGGTKDDIGGYTNLGAREYDTAHGRFITPDPLLNSGDPQQWNGYAYSNNDPVNQSDPSGLMSNANSAGGDGTPGPETDPGPDIWSHPDTGPAPQHHSCGFGCNISKGLKTVQHVATKYPIIKQVASAATSGVTYAGCWGAATFATPETGGASLVAAGMACGGLAGAAGAAVDNSLTEGADHSLSGQIDAAADGVITGAAVGGTGAAAGVAAQGVSNLNMKAALATVSDFLGGGSCKTAPNSFVAGTLVVLADGSTVPIDQVHVGNVVMATDPETGTTLAEPVTATISHNDDVDFTELTVSVDDPNGHSYSSSITSTANHPYWDATTGEWTEAQALRVGDELRRLDGTPVTITAERSYTTAPRTAYNLTVETLHTYYVLAGNAPVLVHNSMCTSLPSASSDKFVVLGRRLDTKIAHDWPDHEVLVMKGWDLDKNDEFIRGVIKKRQTVYLATPITDRSLSNATGESVYAREINQLLSAGYTFSSKGSEAYDYMTPPALR
ncbi:hypothetical protein CFP65_5559 [Kitasatospora sp. MMS16-BH015]|uniref:polymorphic toxin-type HINT domain-containing protein n=1 Tax=Kitasatospora sp. MMS16-BH015 TaxID=2018025 RepID=UPI000CA0DFD0|nr:polymorphic toxin-type HINT domain-containing protein [Kitasatospora sp. MMS16-BH015]AUG80256.1 hypothetical protein CFP65_5559 [Kitasatospora sp. MMS16-BH015]